MPPSVQREQPAAGQHARDRPRARVRRGGVVQVADHQHWVGGAVGEGPGIPVCVPGRPGGARLARPGPVRAEVRALLVLFGCRPRPRKGIVGVVGVRAGNGEERIQPVAVGRCRAAAAPEPAAELVYSACSSFARLGKSVGPKLYRAPRVMLTMSAKVYAWPFTVMGASRARARSV